MNARAGNSTQGLKVYIGAAASFIVGSAAVAQPALEEVTVTAQRREENIQNVPIAVSALTAQALETKGVTDVAQISNFIPNVHLDNSAPFSGSTSVLSAYIRGIGQDDFAFNLDPGVGIYVDGVYYARTVGSNVDMLDVERIEVLKGPQGTLFGRNTIGGAVNIVTQQPSNEFKWKGEVIGGDLRRFDVRGAVNLPLIEDSLLANIAFSSKSRDGYQTRVPYDNATPYVTDGANAFRAVGYDSSNKEGKQNEQNARGKLLWKAGDAVQVTFAADYTNVDQSATPSTLLKAVSSPTDPTAAFGLFYNTCINTPAAVLNSINTAPAGAPAVFGFNTTNGICGPRGVPGQPSMGRVAGTAIGGVNADADPTNNRLPFDNRFISPDIDKTYATGNSFSRIRNQGLATTIAWQLAENVSLKSITAYRDLHWAVGMDLDGSPIDLFQASFSMAQHQTSEELQLSGLAWDSRLNWLVGAYYFNEGGWLEDDVTFPAGLLQIYGPNHLKTDSYAAFTHLNYKLTDQWGLTLGMRYTHEKKQFEGFQHDLNGFNYKISGRDPNNPVDVLALGFENPADPLRYFPSGTQHQSYNDYSPRAGVEFHPADDVMLYTSFSKGFKSGGWTTRLSNPVCPPSSPPAVVPNPACIAPSFGPEKAKTYEVGVKSELFNRRVLLNGAVFFTDYKGIQLNFQEGVSPTIRNAGDARIKGAELEFQGLLTEQFTIASSIGYTDAYYTRIDPRTVGTQLSSSLPKTPDLTFNISPTYKWRLANEAQLTFNVDYTHTAALYNDALNTPLLKRPDSENINASVTFTGSSGAWDLVIGGTNLSDDRYITTGQDQSAGGVIFGTYNPPRQWFAAVRVRSQ